MSEKLKLLQPAQYEGPDKRGWVKVSDISTLTNMSPDEIWDNYAEAVIPEGFHSWNPETDTINIGEKPSDFEQTLIPLVEGDYVRGLSRLGVMNMRLSSSEDNASNNWLSQ